MDEIANSPRFLQQKAFFDSIRNSPHAIAQRQRMESLLGGPAQRREMEELPGEPETAQRLAAEAKVTRRERSPGSPAQLAAPEPKPNNTGLPDGLKSGVESLSGMSLDSVKVHYNSSRPAQLDALAYAQGSDIHVAPGQDRHLPHEAWHVVQQAQGRVKPTMQMKGVPINDDGGLEHEADVMGARAILLRTDSNGVSGAPGHRETQDLESPRSTSSVVQPMLGFELEMHVLVDISGRPVPEKVLLGHYGAHNLEMVVDHGAAVEAPTPTAGHAGNMAFVDNRPGMPPGPKNLGRYDLDTAVGPGALHGPHDVKMEFHNPNVLPLPADPRAAMPPLNDLDPATWVLDTAGNRYTRPGGAAATPFNNASLAVLDNLIAQYQFEVENWEAGVATQLLLGISAAIGGWFAANPQPSLFSPLRSPSLGRNPAKIE